MKHQRNSTGRASGEGPRGVLAGVSVAALLLALLVGGSLATSAVYARGRLFGHHHGRHDPESMRKHVRLFSGWLLYRVEATEEQKSRVEAILDRAIDDLAALRSSHRTLHDAIVTELTAPSIDRSRLEALRVEQVAALDGASRQLVQALGDLAEVLSVEQRLELAEFAEHHSR